MFPEGDAPALVDPATLVLVGAVTGAFGVRGEVKVRSFTASPEGVCGYGPLYDGDGHHILTPQRWRPVKDGLAVTASEVATREAAEALRNTPLYVPRAMLPPTADEEYYHVDLIGCRVEALDGAPLGVVHAVHDFGAGDVLEIRNGAATWYLEFTQAAAPVVDPNSRRIVAMPMEAEE